MIIAQSPGTEAVQKGLLRIFDYVVKFSFPSRAEFVADIQTLPTLQAVGLALGGFAFMVWGFRNFKLFVVINAAAIGALIGIYVGARTGGPNMPLVLGASGAILLGALARPAVKYAVCIMGALAGGAIGFGAWSLIAATVENARMIQNPWVGGVIGILLGGMLAFVAFPVAVMAFTAFQGATMAVMGACSVLMGQGGVKAWLEPELIQSTYMLSIVIGVPALIGFGYQYSVEAARIKKKRRTSEKPPV